MKVRRTGNNCCGMEKDKVYEAEWEFEGHYIKVKLPNGEWTTGHWYPKEFELLDSVGESVK